MDIDFTVAKWIAENPMTFSRAGLTYDDRIGLPFRAVAGISTTSPIFALLRTLEDAGYQVEACRLELIALKDQVQVLHSVMGDVQRNLENAMQYSRLWNCRTKHAAVG
ncbi:hypothetical protein D9M71_555540 [compost metagenome]